jgi:hypothetical protein
MDASGGRPSKQRIVRCKCGRATLAVEGPPIMTVACYCLSCRDAAQRIGSLPGAEPLADSDGGTHFVMQRKDRVACQHGAKLLREHRLKPTSSTRRIIATCCNSAMFLEFESGHWLSLYKARFDPGDQPPLEMRTMTKHRRSGVEFTDDVLSPNKHTLGFMWKLMRAWGAMGFRSPKINFVRGSVDA